MGPRGIGTRFTRCARRRLAARKSLVGEISTLTAESEADREDLLNRLKEVDATIAANPSEGFSDELLLQVYRIVNGITPEGAEAPPQWASIKKTGYGWPNDPIFGYQDLNVRLPANYDSEGNLQDKYDHDGDGRPDLAIDDHSIDIGRILGIPGQFALVFAITPLSLGAGYITGRPGLMVLVGGILAYCIVNPITYNLGWLPTEVDPGASPTGRGHRSASPSASACCWAAR